MVVDIAEGELQRIAQFIAPLDAKEPTPVFSITVNQDANRDELEPLLEKT